jgi:glycosyltransferase involved in cell wall biosynthesis
MPSLILERKKKSDFELPVIHSGCDYGYMEDEIRSNVQEVSIIITTCKENIKTLNFLPDNLWVSDVVISNKAGLGFARNYGASKAKNDLLLFLDDDIILDPEIATYINSVRHGEFGMTFLDGFPCTRVLAVHKDDFWSIGGFDKQIRYTGEDRDFYVRALQAGLRYKPIPISLVQHIPHPVRAKNIHVATQSVKENVLFLKRYWRSHPEVFKVDVWQRLKRGQFRTLLLEAFWFYYLMVNKNE